VKNPTFFKSDQVKNFILQCFEEDVRDGDHSSLSCIPKDAIGKVKLLFKDDGIVAGLDLAQVILEHLDPNVEIEFFFQDGDFVNHGDIGFYATGNVHALLMGERLLLNCMQRLSGIATLTNDVNRLLEGTTTKLLDTRKTTPNLRFLEKWAVTVGGGMNHRMGLYDMIMLKDNHIDFAGGITGALQKAKAYVDGLGKDLKIEIETRNLDEVKEALATGFADRIMLDNFTPERIREALLVINKQCETEASGGITIDNIAEYAKTNVDFISMGALTHSYTSMDISLKHID